MNGLNDCFKNLLLMISCFDEVYIFCNYIVYTMPTLIFNNDMNIITVIFTTLNTKYELLLYLVLLF